MAIDLTGLTETELTELLSSVSPYTKSEMIAWLKTNVKISSSWEKDDAAHTATIHFTPIKDVRALKYIERHPNMGAGGGGAVFFQFLRHPAHPRDRDTNGIRETITYDERRVGNYDATTGSWVTEQVARRKIDVPDDLAKSSKTSIDRSKRKLACYRPSKPVMMLYPEHLVASIYYEHSPDGGTTYYRPCAIFGETWYGGDQDPAWGKSINLRISQWTKDRIEDGTYSPTAQTVGQATDNYYGAGSTTAYFWPCTYYRTSRTPTDKVALSRPASQNLSRTMRRTYAVLTPIVAASGNLTVYTSASFGPTNVLKTVWEIEKLPGKLKYYNKAHDAGHDYVIWAPELLVEGNHRQWFLNEDQGIRPERAFITLIS